MTNIRFGLAAITAGCLAVWSATTVANVSDQSANGGSPQQLDPEWVEEVIVYGPAKRETTLQETDVSVTVFSEADIDDARIRDIRRLDDLVPNVEFNVSGQLSSVFITIRGIESNPFIVNRAAVYIDGAPFRELDSAVLNRINSIEVLRGPQATLYGANSEAGLILINTLEPDFEVEGSLRGTASFFENNHAYSLDGFFSAPIIDDELAASIAFNVADEDSFFPNPLSSIGEEGAVEELFIQGRLLWTPTEDLTIKAGAYVIDIDAPGIFDEEYMPADRLLYNATYGAFNGGRFIDEFELLQDAPKETTRTDYVGTVAVNYQLPEGQLNMAVSYTQEDEDSRGNDLDFTSLPTAAGAAIFDQEIWNAEIRFSSVDTAVIRYMIGASYYNEEETLLIGTLVGPGELSDYAFAPPQTNFSEDIALFGSVTADLGIEGLSTTVGLRYDRARRETDQTAGALNFGPLGDAIFQDLNFDDTFEEVLPRLALNYRPTSSLTIYASAAKGYIPGGFNLTIAQEAVADELVSYGSEQVWSYEIGAKIRFNSGKGHLNAAAFLIDGENWQEIQVITNDQGQVQSSAFIASDAEIESIGVELEFKYAISDELMFSANLGYVDAEYSQLMPTSVEDLSGNQIKLVPEYDANIALTYNHPVGFFARAEISALGETALDERNRFIRDPVEVWNFQLGFSTGRWTVRAFLENATNERYESGSAFDNFAFGFDGNAYASYDRPRVVGMEFEMNFGARQ